MIPNTGYFFRILSDAKDVMGFTFIFDFNNNNNNNNNNNKFILSITYL